VFIHECRTHVNPHLPGRAACRPICPPLTGPRRFVCVQRRASDAYHSHARQSPIPLNRLWDRFAGPAVYEPVDRALMTLATSSPCGVSVHAFAALLE
jgi:hypothetical protein